MSNEKYKSNNNSTAKLLNSSYTKPPTPPIKKYTNPTTQITNPTTQTTKQSTNLTTPSTNPITQLTTQSTNPTTQSTKPTQPTKPVTQPIQPTNLATPVPLSQVNVKFAGKPSTRRDSTVSSLNNASYANYMNQENPTMVLDRALIPKRTKSAPPEDVAPPHLNMFIPHKSSPYNKSPVVPNNKALPPLSLTTTKTELSYSKVAAPKNLDLSKDSPKNSEPIITSALTSNTVPLSSSSAPFQFKGNSVAFKPQQNYSTNYMQQQLNRPVYNTPYQGHPGAYMPNVALPQGAVISATPMASGQPISNVISMNAVPVGSSIPVVASSGSPLVYPTSGPPPVSIAVLPPTSIQPNIQSNVQYPYYYNGQMQRVYPQFPTQQLVPYPQQMIPAGQMMQPTQMVQPGQMMHGSQIVQNGQLVQGQMMQGGQMIPGPTYVQITPPQQQPVQPLQQTAQTSVPFVPRVKKVLAFKDPETKESLVFDKPVETKPVETVTVPPAEVFEPSIENVETKVEVVAPVSVLQPQKIEIKSPLVSASKENITTQPSTSNDSFSESDDDLQETDNIDDSKSEDTKKSYSSPYTIFDLIKLKPIPCPRPAKLPHVKDVTDDIITVNQEYEASIKQTKVNYYNQPSGNKHYNQDYSRNRQTNKGARQSISIPVATNLPQLQKASARWTPGMAGNTKSVLGDIAKKIKGILNRLNTNFFDILSKELMELINANVTNIDQLSEVVDMLFVTALAQPGFGPVYAEACVLLNSSFESVPVTSIDDAGVSTDTRITFKKILLSKCQYEFEEMGNAARALAADTTLSADERHIARSKAKVRELGNIKFIGELFKRNMVSEKVIHMRALESLFLLNLSDPAHEEELEALCKLFINIGINLDVEKVKPRMEVYFDRLKAVGASPAISNRMKFMIKDLVELRESNWKARTSPASTPPSSDPNIKYGNYPQQQYQQFGNRPVNSQHRQSYSDQSNQQRIILQHNRNALNPNPSTQSSTPSYRSNSITSSVNMGYTESKYYNKNNNPPPSIKVPYNAKGRSDSISLPAQTESNPSTPLVSSRFVIGDSFMDDNDIFIKNVSDAIREYTTSASFDEFCVCVNSINSPIKWELVIMQLLLLNGDFSDQERISILKLAQSLFKLYKFDAKVVTQGLAIAFTFMEEIWVDSPRLTVYVGELLAPLIIEQHIPLSSIYSNLPLILEPKLIQSLLGDTLKNVSNLDVSNVYLTQMQSYPKNLLMDNTPSGIESFLNNYMLSKLK